MCLSIDTAWITPPKMAGHCSATATTHAKVFASLPTAASPCLVMVSYFSFWMQGRGQPYGVEGVRCRSTTVACLPLPMMVPLIPHGESGCSVLPASLMLVSEPAAVQKPSKTAERRDKGGARASTRNTRRPSMNGKRSFVAEPLRTDPT